LELFAGGFFSDGVENEELGPRAQRGSLPETKFTFFRQGEFSGQATLCSRTQLATTSSPDSWTEQPANAADSVNCPAALLALARQKPQDRFEPFIK
jgi:hypothetical protein